MIDSAIYSRHTYITVSGPFSTPVYKARVYFYARYYCVKAHDLGIAIKNCIFCIKCQVQNDENTIYENKLRNKVTI